jgi:hypothetical protein
MSVTLARRMISDGVVAPEDVKAALLAHVTERAPFLEALLRLRPDLEGRLALELGGARRREAIVPDAALLNRLPAGLVTTLLAVPVGRDPQTRTIHVVAADASEPHLAEELAYHFGEPVRVSIAPLGQVLAAVPARRVSDPRGLTPAFGTIPHHGPMVVMPRANGAETLPARADEVGGRPSEPPIPLVRVSPDLGPAPATVKGVAPQAMGSAHASRVVVPPRATAPAAPEPVIELTRPKSHPIASTATLESEAAREVAPPAVAAEEAPAPDSGLREAPNFEAVLSDLEAATSADDALAAMIRGLSLVAARVIVLAARGKVYEGRDANDPSILPEVRALVISGDRPNVLITAAKTGHYVGPIPRTLVHAELARLLGDPSDEIAVGVVPVSGRPALVYVLAGLAEMGTTYLATRSADQLAAAMSKALERIVRHRKR